MFDTRKNAKQLREMLLGKEMSFLLLDDIISSNGYYSAIYDRISPGIPKYVKDKLFVVYDSLGKNSNMIAISFDITIDNEPDQPEECFCLKILDIQGFDRFVKKYKKEKFMRNC